MSPIQDRMKSVRPSRLNMSLAVREAFKKISSCRAVFRRLDSLL